MRAATLVSVWHLGCGDNVIMIAKNTHALHRILQTMSECRSETQQRQFIYYAIRLLTVAILLLTIIRVHSHDRKCDILPPTALACLPAQSETTIARSPHLRHLDGGVGAIAITGS